MYKLIKPFAMTTAVSLLVAGCSSYVSPEEAQTKSVKNSKSAFKVLETAGIQQSVSVKSISGQKATGFNTKFFNMAFAGVEANMVTEASIELGNSPSAQQIKKDGFAVFTYLKPRYKVRKQNAGSEKTYPVSKRLYLPNGVGSFCNGYYVILTPQNGYKRSWTIKSKIELAEKDSGIDGGVWGNLGSSNWRVTDVTDVITSRSTARDGTFYHDHGSRMLNNCYADEATKKAWLANK
jgi:hypothetical protein